MTVRRKRGFSWEAVRRGVEVGLEGGAGVGVVVVWEGSSSLSQSSQSSFADMMVCFFGIAKKL